MAQVLHRYCLICAAGYWCQRRTAKYCSVACRMKAARLKGERERLGRRLEEINKVLKD